MDIFRENREFWLYILGIIILFFIFFWGANYFLRGEDPFNRDNGGTVKDIPDTYDAPPEYFIDTDEDYFAIMETSLGTLEIDLYEKSAPVNVNNFAFLAGAGYYDGLDFYRLIPNLLLQGGSRAVLNDNPKDDDLGTPGYYIKNEINWDSLDFSEIKRKELRDEGFSSNKDVFSKRMVKYSLVMANGVNEDGNEVPNSTGSQFFIIIADDGDPRLEYLRGRHTVIGEIVEGKDVVDRIRNFNVSDKDDGSGITRPEEKITLELVEIEAR